ncbi:Phage Major Tail tube protein [Xanthomonas phage Suba]|uniref:Phage Major Tail tube protein n=1 Tax=Xanthomonas phage Suba TaxID=2674975 RepID=A0A679KGF4_9CAUD|nr:Phage Major Tail tube protein [Xanthomonas phage Suba]CAA2409753.1 Phage Major Tail tube protein [Xanthomonas phage Suba]
MARICDNEGIDGGLTGLRIAEEVCLKELPTQAIDGFDPTWHTREPNSYSDFGGDVTLVAREIIDPSRQNKKGRPTDLDASGGWNEDLTQSNIGWLAQGFFFANAREAGSTDPFDPTKKIAITAVTSADKRYAAASGLDAIFAEGQLVKASGFASASNNGLKRVTAVAAGYIEVAEALIAEASPSAKAKVEVVGGQFEAGDVSIAVVDGIPSLVSTATDFTTFPGLIPGKWLFLGGDVANSAFVNNTGFARIASVSANAIVFDDTTWQPVNEAGAGLSVQFFSGPLIRNEKERALIKRRSYTIERTLGEDEATSENPGDEQGEYLLGAVPNELTLNIPVAEKFNVDYTFVACDNDFRSGAAGDKLRSLVGTVIPALGEDFINTSSDIYRIKMNILDPATSNPTGLFAWITEGNIAINNGITPTKVVGKFGAGSVSADNFAVTGEVTALFTSVAACRAIRESKDVGFNVIAAYNNAGMIWDLPLVSLGGGRLNVEKGQPVSIPLNTSAAENVYGYTAMLCLFPYLPDAAMPK